MIQYQIEETYGQTDIGLVDTPFLTDNIINLESITYMGCKIFWNDGYHTEKEKILDTLLKKYNDYNFSLTLIGEAYNKNYKKPIDYLIKYFKDKPNSITILSGNLSDNLTHINHKPIIQWLGRSKCSSWVQSNERKFKKKFLFKSRRYTSERKKVLNHLIDNNIINDTYCGYMSADPTSKFHRTVEGYPITDNLTDEQNYIKEYYFKSFCNIVPESSLEYIFLTEKIDKPINAQQPFLVLGACGYLNKLHELKFKTFSKWWDESYDSETNNKKRIDKVIKNIDYINSLTMTEINDIYNEMIPILGWNTYIRNKYWGISSAG